MRTELQETLDHHVLRLEQAYTLAMLAGRTDLIPRLILALYGFLLLEKDEGRLKEGRRTEIYNKIAETIDPAPLADAVTRCIQDGIAKLDAGIMAGGEVCVYLDILACMRILQEHNVPVLLDKDIITKFNALCDKVNP